MANIIGKVIEIDGNLEIVDENGDIIKLKDGEELIIGDDLKATIKIVDGEIQLFSPNGEIINLQDGQTVSLDDTLNQNTLESENRTTNVEQDLTVKIDNGQEVVVNNQNPLLIDQTVVNTEVADTQETTIENETLTNLDNELGNEENLIVQNNNDNDNGETTEQVVQSDSSKARELDRNAEITDVTADLRDAENTFRENENIEEDQVIETLEAELSIEGDSEVIEGNDGSYILKLTEAPITDLTVELTYTGVATDGVDFTAVKKVIIPAGETEKTFDISTIDDYFAEGSEIYNLTITSITGGGYDVLDINPEKDNVETTILDSSSPGPNNETPSEEDTIYAILTGPDYVKEGETTSTYIIELQDKDGNPVNVSSNTDVTVVFTNGSANDADYEFGNGQTTTVTINAGSSSGTFAVDTNDDFYKEGDETYSVSIDNVNTSEFEKIEISGDVTTTIYDAGSTPPTGNPPEVPEDIDTVYIQLTNDDSTGEGENATLTHNIKLVDKDGNPVNLPNGETITVNLSYSDISGVDGVEAEDFTTLQTSITITGDGSDIYSFNNIIAEDFFKEGVEGYSVSIDSITANSEYFENLAIDTNNNTATGLISDDEPGSGTPPPGYNPPGDEIPNEDSDTIYVQLTNNATADEIDGNKLVHTISLVDKDNNPVTVPTGNTIKIKLTYTNDSTENEDFTTKVLEIEIPSGSSSIDIENIIKSDYIYEVEEGYTLEISEIIDSDNSFENMEVHNSNNSVTGTIEDEDKTTPDDKNGDKPVISLVAIDDSAVEGTSNNTIVFKLSQDNVSNFDSDVIITLDLNEVEAADLDSTVSYLDASGNPATTTLAELQSGLAITIPANSSYSPEFTFTSNDDSIYEVSESLSMSVALATGEADATISSSASSDTASIYDEDKDDPTDPNPPKFDGDKPVISLVAIDDSAVEGTSNNTIVFKLSQDNVSNFDSDVIITLDLNEVEAADLDSTVSYLDASGNPATTTLAELQSGLAITIPANSSYSPEFTFTSNDDSIYEVSESLSMSVALATGEADATISSSASSDTASIYDEDKDDPTDPNPPKFDGDKPVISLVAIDDSAVEGTSNNTIVFKLSQDNVSNFDSDVIITLDLNEVEAADLDSTVSYLDASGNPATTTLAELQSGLAITIPANSSYSPEFTFTSNDDSIYEVSESLSMSVALATGEADATISSSASSDTASIYDEDKDDPTDPNPPKFDGDKPVISLVAIDDSAVEGTSNNTIVFKLSQDNVSNFDSDVIITLDLNEVEAADLDSTVSYLDASGNPATTTLAELQSGLAITIPANSSYSPEFTFTSNDDSIYEVSESLSMSVALATGEADATISSSASSDTASIYDEDKDDPTDPNPPKFDGDKPVISLVAIDDSAVEGTSNNTIVFKLSQDNVSNFDSDVIITLDLNEVEAADLDSTVSYLDASGNPATTTLAELQSGLAITIPANSSYSPEFTFTSNDDSIYEVSESLSMSVALATGEADATISSSASSDTASIYDEDKDDPTDPNPPKFDGDKPVISLVAIDDSAVEGTSNNTIVFKLSQDNVSNFDSDVIITLDLNEVEAADLDSTVSYLDASGNPATTTLAELQSGLAITIPANSSYSPEFTFTSNDDSIYEVSESLSMSVALATGEADATISSSASSDTASIYDEDKDDPTDPNPPKFDGDKPVISLVAIDDSAVEGTSNNTIVFKLSQDNVSNFDSDVIITLDLNEVEAADLDSTVSYLDASGNPATTTLAELQSGLAITIPANSSYSPEFTFTSNDDSIYEVSESLSMSVALATGEADATISSSASSDTASIYDEDKDDPTDPNPPKFDGDKPVISLVAIDDSAVEGTSNNTIVFKLSQDNVSNFDSDVIITLDLNEVEAADLDSTVSYLDASGNPATTTLAELQSGLAITIPANSSYSPEFTFTSNDDSIYEVSESLSMSVALATGEADATISSSASSDTASIYDEDKDDPTDPNPPKFDGDKPVISLVAIDDSAVEGTSNNTIVFKLSQDNVSNFDSDVIITLDLNEVEAADLDSTVSYLDASGNPATTTLAELQSGLAITIPANSSYSPEFTFTSNDDSIYEVSESLSMSVALATGEADATISSSASSDTASIYDEDKDDPTDPNPPKFDGDKPVISLVAIDDSAVEGTSNNTIVFKLSQDNVSNFDSDVIITLDLNEVEAADLDSTVSYLDASGNPATTTLAELQSGLAITIPANSSYSPEFTFTSNDDSIYEVSESLSMSVALATGEADATISSSASSDTASIYDEDKDDPTDPNPPKFDGDAPTLSINNVTVTEGTDNYAVFIVSQDKINLTDVIFDLTLIDNSANGLGVDYGSTTANNIEISTDNGVTWTSSTTGTIVAGETSILVRTPIINDGDVEVSETFNLKATVTSGTVLNSSSPQGTGTILDNDTTPTVQNLTIRVSEEGLTNGIIDTTGENVGDDTTDATSKVDTMSFSDLDGDSLAVTSISLASSAPVLESEGNPITWSGVANNDGSYTLTGSANLQPVMTVNITSDGTTTVNLLKPFDHPTNSVEDVLSFDFDVTVSDGTNNTTGTLNVKVEDDMPSATDVTDNTTLASQDTNILLIIDTSGSMGSSSGISGKSRMDATKDAINQLLDTYSKLGDVSVRIVGFTTTATIYGGSTWTSDIANAKSIVSGLTPTSVTNYDAGLAVAMDAYTSSGKIAGATNVAYFFGDGEPNANDGDPTQLANSNSQTSDDIGIQPAEEDIWKNFLETNDINAFALGIGTGLDATDQAYLDPVSYDGTTATDKDAVMVTDFALLPIVLNSTLPASSQGNVFDIGTGADSAYVFNLTVDGEIYTYDSANNIITTSGNDNTTHIYNSNSKELSIATQEESTFTINLETGEFKFVGNPNATSDYTESFTFELIDGDGDKINKTITQNVIVPPVEIGTPLNAEVDEENLSDGTNPSSSDLTVTKTLDVTSGNDTFDVTFNNISDGDDSGLTSNGSTVYYYLDDTSHTLTASTSTTEAGIDSTNTVFTNTITDPTASSASYSFTLNDAIDHVTANGENTKDIAFDIIATENNGYTTTDSFTVSIVDDVPTIYDNEDSIFIGPKTVNLVLVLDVSGSMSYAFDGSGSPANERLQAEIDSAVAMINGYADLGEVNVMVTTFSSTITVFTDSATSSTIWLDKTDAITQIQNINAGGSTYYSTAMDSTANAYVNSYNAGDVPDSDFTYVYFMSDGQPTGGYEPANSTQWESFISRSEIDAVDGVAISTAVDVTNLQIVAGTDSGSALYNSNGKGEAYSVTTASQMTTKLAEETTLNITGNVFTDGSITLIGEGADEAYVTSIGIGSKTYYYDGTTISDELGVTVGSNGIMTDIDTTLTDGVNGIGSKLSSFNFETGAYTYTIDSTLTGQEYSETLQVSVIDNDGDTATKDLIMKVNTTKTGTTGDDSILFTDKNALDFLAGNDSLVLDSGINLDFDTKNSTISNVENLDLNANGDHTIDNLGIQDVLDITDSNNILTILGNTTDSVNLKNGDGGNWEDTGTDETINGQTYDVYSKSGDNSAVTLKIDQDINTNII